MVRKYENNVTPLRAGYQMESSWQKMQAQTGDYVNLGEKLEKLREEIRKEIDSVK